MLRRQLILLSLFFLLAVKGSDEYRQRREALNGIQTNSKNNLKAVNTNAAAKDRPGIAATLGQSDECKADITKYCGKGSSNFISNIKALQCIDDLDNAVNLISKDCQNLIYQFKFNMTHNIRFDDAANRLCANDIKKLEDCSDVQKDRGTGHLITCLYDLYDNVTDPTCRSFLKQIQALVFTDWRLSEPFTEACLADIKKLECGRLDDEKNNLAHDQGAVMSCLAKKQDDLSKNCQKHIQRLAELQSDDYHLDRALYYACREDRERFCSQVAAGNGRVYRCLYAQKFNSLLSPVCREEIHRRQKMVVSNVKVDVPLIRACKSEMTEHNCSAAESESGGKLTLVKLLLCLERRLKTGNAINDECRREMLVHRRMLMSDYAISPQIVSNCRNEMIRHCSRFYSSGVSGTIDQRGGRMLHCLLNAARTDKNFSSNCLLNVKSLVRAVDAASDIRADPLLETTCRPVIDSLCSKVKPGDSNVIMCLLDNIKNTKMIDECEERLMEIAYFMVRDWRITPRLMQTCRANLIQYCHLPDKWIVDEKMDDVYIGKYLSCLYENKQALNTECRSELKQLMRIRSQSVGLMPEVEDKCIEDLASCNRHQIKGEEMKCLQNKYNKLEQECKEAVKKYTTLTMADPSLDYILMKACEPMVQRFCSNTENGNENDLVRCLIRQKNNPSMDSRCRAGIEHHQIVSMKDQAFLSESFRKKCTGEIDEHCPMKKTKSGIIQCLAKLMLHDVLRKANLLSSDCEDELKFELLQRSETINLDPALANACSADIRQHCPGLNPGNSQVLDCLKKNRNRLSPNCFLKIKRRQNLDVIAPEEDYSLMSKCSPTIQKFCSNQRKQNLLTCLRRNANQATMSSNCRLVLYQRLMALNTDARFNKNLIDNCNKDINKYCRDEVIDDDDDNNDDDDEDNTNEKDDDDGDNQTNDFNDGEVKDRDMGGRIINCLRTKYADKNAALESQCVAELIDVIQGSKLDIEFDVVLYQKCRTILEGSCIGLDKEDCLKVLYQHNRITDQQCRKEVIRIIKEGKADVHVDQTLTLACQADLIKYCNDIPIGEGKQLQCLLKIRKSVTKDCRKILTERQELWKSISDVDDFDDLAEHIVKSSNSRYILSILIIAIILIFLSGRFCRSPFRYQRLNKHN